MYGFAALRYWSYPFFLRQLFDHELHNLAAYIDAAGTAHSSHSMPAMGGMGNSQMSMGMMGPIHTIMQVGNSYTFSLNTDQSGGTSDNVILNFKAQEVLSGGAADDLIVLHEMVGNVSGGNGHDAVILPWDFEDVSFSNSSGTLTLTHNGDTVSMEEVELISFSDATVSTHAVIHDLGQGNAPFPGSVTLAKALKNLPVITENGTYNWGDVDHADGHSMPNHGHMSHDSAVMDLVRIDETTIVAIKSGDWSDPSIWSEGRVPSDGDRVFIPDGSLVTVDEIFCDVLFTVRVDGKLAFDPNTDTGLTLDTLVIAASGELAMGTQDNPIDGGANAHIHITDNGPIDLTWDPGQLSRGIVALGEVTVHGEEKLTHTKVVDAPRSGDTFIELEDSPLNWHVGDSIVITGTQFTPKSYNPETGEYDIYNGTEDEVRVITQIDGKTIWFDEPLVHDHTVPRDGLAASVANMSRSVVWETLNADDLPSNQRAHSMFMHNDDVDVRYLQVQEFGRTDRSTGMDDYETFVMSNEWKSEGRVRDTDGNWIDGDATNIRGRYAVHFHMAGVDADENPGLLKGCSVWGSPGWGYVQHNSYANFEDNVAFDVYGSSFVGETGDEVGTWTNNIAIAGEGREKYIKWGTYNMDLGGEGYGFWMNGRSINLIDNIAAGMSGGGYAWFSRGIDMIETKAENLANPELARGLDTVHDVFLPFGTVTGNEVYATETGYFAIRGIETASQQLNDSRSMMTDFKAWDVQQGFHIEYSSSYTFSDGLIISADINQPHTGLKQLRNAGILINRNYEDLVMENVEIDGFVVGVFHIHTNTLSLDRQASGFEFQDENGYGLRFIDVNIHGANVDYSARINQDVSIVARDTIEEYELSLDIDNSTLVAMWDSDESRFNDPLAVSRGIVLEGTKYDSLGVVEFPDGNERIYYTQEQVNALLSKEGYFTDSHGDTFLFIRELITDRRTGEALIVPMVVEIDPDWKIPKTAFDNGLTFEDLQDGVQLPDDFLWA